ncbi:MAG: alcohol dehydrogenase [Bacteroidota bacterium]|nr:MAG: alcohol dehydrogenase zinc-binding domain-containing protein [Bacteroidetes bacterium OLB12]GIL21604.1 MAG: alcohol dehydrogenase [Bacteroidota bacterium]
MIATKGYAAQNPTAQLQPFNFNRREVGPHDVRIEIAFCGVCHSDLHQVRDEWGGSIYPMVPGHEIVGRISKVGSAVTKFKAGDLAGVGCFVDSCRVCESCRMGNEQYCEAGMAGTYNGYEMDKKTPTYGGYSNCIVVDENYTLRISEKLPLAAVAPLLCAGITTYSPLRHWKVGAGQRVAVVGLGGLGHMAVKFAVSFGASVTVLSSSPGKEADAKKLGAHHFVNTRDKIASKQVRKSFDFILDTVSAQHDLNFYLSLLKTDGTMVMVGIPPQAEPVDAFSLIGKRKTLAGSMIGGIRETQEMLDYCAENKIVSDIELIPIQQIEQAYQRMAKGDVRYRFVIDMATL